MAKVVNQILDTCIYTPLPTLPPEYMSRSVPLKTLIAMSKREHHLRLNDADYQRRFKAASRDGHRELGGLRVYEARAEEQGEIIIEIQHRVLAEHGYAKKIGEDERTGAEIYAEVDELALYELRTAAFQYPEEPIFQDTVYFKYNRAGDVPLEDGDQGPDCALFHIDTRAPTSLYEHLAKLTPEEEAELAAVAQAGGDVSTVRFPRVIVSGSYT